VVDIVTAPGERPETGTDTPGTILFRAGGSASNTARAVVALGGQSALIAAVGGDRWGTRLASAVRGAGVTARIVPKPGTTARIVVLLSPGGERTFITQRGAADLLAPGDLRPAWFSSAAALHLPAYSLFAEPLASAGLRAVELARAVGAIVSVDLASRRPLLAHGRRPTWRRIDAVGPDVLFATGAEARALAGTGDETTLLQLAPVVVVKEGAGGARVLARAAANAEAADGPPLRLTVATQPLHAADTTGAGDAFDAGFLLALLGSLRDEPGLLAAGASGQGAALRRAAVAGHAAAARLLKAPRPELPL
jgi:sugar/nucleoside kinase (ribokinase family)